jgi:hypothetical protein
MSRSFLGTVDCKRHTLFFHMCFLLWLEVEVLATPMQATRITMLKTTFSPSMLIYSEVENNLFTRVNTFV